MDETVTVIDAEVADAPAASNATAVIVYDPAEGNVNGAEYGALDALPNCVLTPAGLST